MTFTTLISPDALKTLGLPHAVAQMESRKIVAAFESEDDALDYIAKLQPPPKNPPAKLDKEPTVPITFPK